jgi:hypothetical protein
VEASYGDKSTGKLYTWIPFLTLEGDKTTMHSSHIWNPTSGRQ